MKLPFLLARVLDEEVHDDSTLVKWFLPGSTRLGGRGRARPDLFGAWTPLSERQAGDGDTVLPPALVAPELVLVGRVELDA